MADLWERDGIRSGLSGAEAGALSRQIADLTRAGMPLSAGLTALSEELPRGRLRRSMTDLADALDAGVPLDLAMETQQGKIPATCAGSSSLAFDPASLATFSCVFPITPGSPPISIAD